MLKTRVILYLGLELLISNWHILCYLGFVFYCFSSGGAAGFAFIILLVSFVFVEESYPSLIFWRLAFFNACFASLLKLIVFQIWLDELEEKKKTANPGAANAPKTTSFKTFHWSYMLLGESNINIDSVVIILIIIQLVLLDEMGLK